MWAGGCGRRVRRSKPGGLTGAGWFAGPYKVQVVRAVGCAGGGFTLYKTLCGAAVWAYPLSETRGLCGADRAPAPVLHTVTLRQVVLSFLVIHYPNGGESELHRVK